ncbi:MAG: phosphonate ABC transporter ATP-binding protein [Alphaproteobacteria bacterium]
MTNEALRLDGLTKTYGRTNAVDAVSLTVPKGQMIGVIGRSGAGKSTLLRLINRMTDPTGGEICFGGRRVDTMRGRELLAWRASCAMIFQQFNLVPRLDVLTNVLLGRINMHRTVPSLFKRFSRAERALAVEALDRLDLLPHAMQRAETLSGGQQQRVAIARALMQQPSIMLADEPIASLDPRNAAHVMDALKSINVEDGITVLCNLHTLDTARQYCDRVVGMAHGRVVFDGAPDALTAAAVREIYQVSDSEAGFDEGVTSVSGWPEPALPPAYVTA